MKSIKAKLSFGIIGITLLFVIFTWFLNFNIMEKYYVAKTKNILLKSAEEIEKSEYGKIEDFIRYQERAKGMFITIYNKKLENKFQNSDFFRFRKPMKYDDRKDNKNKDEISPKLKDKINSENGKNPADKRRNENEIEQEEMRGKDRFGDGKRDEFRPIPPEMYFKESIDKLKEKRYIFNDRKDNYKKIYFINLTYKMNNGEYIFIFKPNEAIAESASIAAKFSLFSGLITIILGVVYALFFSAKFTKPILLINENAKKIAKLEFNEECVIESDDEIGELGKSINIMSGKLSGVIAELRQSNLKLEKEIEYERSMEKMRKEFVSSVSHELRTPISLIRGYAEGLKYSIMDREEDKEFYCDVIVDEAGKMTKLISDLLDLAQIESGTYKIEKSDINISEILEVIVNKYYLLFKEKGITINFDIEEEIWIKGDKVRIEQVISNFINNGVNHIDGEKRIEIGLKTNGKNIRISIFNTGKNIPKDAENRIWESFYKVDKARSRDYGGVGLGLSIVSGILKLHNGKYGFVNKDNGVEFWMEIEKI